MRLHTKLTRSEVLEAMKNCKEDGRISREVYFASNLDERRSMKNDRAFEVALGTYDDADRFVSTGVAEYLTYAFQKDFPDRAKDKNLARAIKRTGMRRHRNQNAKDTEEGLTHSATWHEWGFFIAELFRLDSSVLFGPYTSHDEFIRQTANADREAIVLNARPTAWSPRVMDWDSYSEFAHM